MRKFLLVMILAISMALFGCSSKDNEEIGDLDKESINISVDNEDDKLEDIEKSEDEKDLEEDQEIDEIKDGEELEEIAKEIEDKIEDAKEDSEKAAGEIESGKSEVIKESIEDKHNAMSIEGKVGKPLSLDLDDLKSMNDILFKGNFYSLNNFGTTAYTEFKGVNLWKLLDLKAEILDEASKVRIIASDGYEMEFAIDQVKKQDYIDETDETAKFPIIIAWEENGEEYDLDDGLPFKLVIGQKEAGDINKPQWVSNIQKIIVE